MAVNFSTSAKSTTARDPSTRGRALGNGDTVQGATTTRYTKTLATNKKDRTAVVRARLHNGCFRGVVFWSLPWGARREPMHDVNARACGRGEPGGMTPTGALRALLDRWQSRSVAGDRRALLKRLK